MLRWIKSILNSATGSVAAVAVAAESARDLLWPSNGSVGHPWANLYTDEQKHEVMQQVGARAKSISLSENPFLKNREWIGEAILMRTTYEVFAIAPPRERNEFPWSDFPCVSGELQGQFDRYIELSEGDLLSQVSSAREKSTRLQTEFANALDATKEALLIRMNRGIFELAVANSMRPHIGDSPEREDWLVPLLACMWTWQEECHRKLLGMPQRVADGGLRFRLLLNIVMHGSRNPLAEWRENHQPRA